MENDSVRTSGAATLVNMWINDKLRSVLLTHDAIHAFLHLTPDREATMSDEDRREFVRTNLGLVVAAAKDRLRYADPEADSVVIEAGQLRRQSAIRARGGERRSGDRRKGNRRKGDLGLPPSDERRR